MKKKAKWKKQDARREKRGRCSSKVNAIGRNMQEEARRMYLERMKKQLRCSMRA
jgi:hypothetical protein